MIALRVSGLNIYRERERERERADADVKGKEKNRITKRKVVPNKRGGLHTSPKKVIKEKERENKN